MLKVTPFTQYGRPLEIKKSAFGGKEQYEQAISELEDALYDNSMNDEPKRAWAPIYYQWWVNPLTIFLFFITTIQI